MNDFLIKMTMGLGLMALAAQHVSAQPGNCAPRDVVVQKLTQKFSESRRGIGLIRQTAVMEIFASEDSGSWTILITRPDGISCLIAAGQDYQTRADTLPAQGRKS